MASVIVLDVPNSSSIDVVGWREARTLAARAASEAVIACCRSSGSANGKYGLLVYTLASNSAWEDIARRSFRMIPMLGAEFKATITI